ncbi:hypothetical protein F947_01781 [Acinetobacter towneri DSM 14962 = CIP 107472]|nr:hypothetical protein F947_01781 [Acinetobacter towneri DSM 14962 = CIP 107472]
MKLLSSSTQLKLRISPALKSWLKKEALLQNRSLNSQVNFILTQFKQITEDQLKN